MSKPEARPSAGVSAREGGCPPASLIRRGAESYVEAWRMFSRMVERGAVAEEDGATLVKTGLGAPHFNPMFVTRAPRDPAGAMERARSFYGRDGVPWELVLVSSEATGVEPYAEAAGLAQAGVNPGMLLAPLTGEAPEAPGLTVRVVDTPEELAVYNDLLARGFELDPEVLAQLNSPETLPDEDVIRYLGYSGGEPVVTSMRATAHRIAVIFNVVTMPSHRRLGYGGALTRRAAEDGAREGCVASFLQSTVMGYPLYLKMGYRHVVDFKIWQALSAEPG